MPEALSFSSDRNLDPKQACLTLDPKHACSELDPK
jgi:hypothetical protein